MMSFMIPSWAKWAALAVMMAGMYLFGRGDGKAIAEKNMMEYQITALETMRQVEATYRAKELALNKQVEEARNAAVLRETKLQGDAAAARAESGRLRDDLAAFRRNLPGFTEAAIRSYADAASVVLDQCQREYQGLAEQADRIDSDRQTLMDAWPK